MNEEIKPPKCVGGLGIKKSNGGTQYFQQDRVYMGEISLAIPSQLPSGSYMYLIEEENEIERRDKNDSNRTNG